MSDWEKRRVIELVKIHKDRLQREIDNEVNIRLSMVEPLTLEAESLIMECLKEEINPTDKWEYKKGLRLMYIGTMINDPFIKAVGREFTNRYRK